MAPGLRGNQAVMDTLSECVGALPAELGAVFGLQALAGGGKAAFDFLVGEGAVVRAEL
ncbi:MAG: hypothetical protein K0Q72_5403, partial [Armatimonadetes bacterium]|nr:hypothetical protein [Armatimonadota bacterium]